MEMWTWEFGHMEMCNREYGNMGMGIWKYGNMGYGNMGWEFGIVKIVAYGI